MTAKNLTASLRWPSMVCFLMAAATSLSFASAARAAETKPANPREMFRLLGAGDTYFERLTGGVTVVKFYVDAATAQVRRVLLVDAQGNRNRFDFLSPTINAKVEPSEFAFVPPSGTQVVRQ